MLIARFGSALLCLNGRIYVVGNPACGSMVLCLYCVRTYAVGVLMGGLEGACPPRSARCGPRAAALPPHVAHNRGFRGRRAAPAPPLRKSCNNMTYAVGVSRLAPAHFAFDRAVLLALIVFDFSCSARKTKHRISSDTLLPQVHSPATRATAYVI